MAMVGALAALDITAVVVEQVDTPAMVAAKIKAVAVGVDQVVVRIAPRMVVLQVEAVEALEVMVLQGTQDNMVLMAVVLHPVQLLVVP